MHSNKIGVLFYINLLNGTFYQYAKSPKNKTGIKLGIW